ncbi:MAG TPA: condensation domain-containing protein, partial [Thermoanaerobaculia bacterium]|nr:condensation domain-containing protein [Thermoanaerobaculia bacterium]
LVAYVVGEASVLAELRGSLKQSLPEHMVPSAFVVLDRLPLTANGKVDRKALPPPAGERPEWEAEYVAPRTLIEELLAAIWAQVLGLERVGIHDNFFALGGDSILTLRVVALGRERGLELELADLFQHQTIEELGAAVRLGGVEETRSEPLSLISEEDRRQLPADVEDAYPLSFLQAGMLFHMELAPEDLPYHNADSWQVRGRLEAELFAEALRRVTARHPMMRTSFAMTGYSEPLQLVHRSVELPLTVEDIRHLSPAEQEAAVDRLVAREKLRRFDLTRAPQLRFHIFVRSSETFQLTLTENHAIFDGWSLHSTLAEMFELYFALLSGAAPEPQPPLTLTYREYVRLEREALASEASEGYWRRLLHQAEPVELPHWPSEWCRPGPYQTGVRVTALPPEVVAGLKRLAREVAMPLKSVLLAAHLKVLSLLAGRPDVVSGVVSNGRLEENEGDQVRGLFLNTLPLRLRLPEGSWADLVRAAFYAEQETLAHRRYPFAALQRQWGERPLFEIAFNYIHFHVIRDLLRSGNLEIVGFKKLEGSHFKLQAHFVQDLEQQGLILEIEHDSHALPGVLAQQIGDTYLHTLALMARDPQSTHAEARIVPPAGRHQLLTEWNDTDVDLAGARRCLHELIEEQARRAPGRVAVEIEGESLTYKDLSQRSSQLARYLQRAGVGPEVRVGICVERSLDLMVGLLGILKAGGAYVPLDPESSPERLADRVEDSCARLVLTQESLAGALRRTSIRQVLLDRDWEEIADESGEAPEAKVGPDNLACVIYTPESASQPKGAMNTHRGIVNRLLSMQSSRGLDGMDAALLKELASFDATFWRCLDGGAEQGAPVGRPLANTRIYLLDRRLDPVPVGVVGELYIGGGNLARGYVERPSLTAERFVPSPFGCGERLYWTGDRARYWPDGTIEYLGPAQDGGLAHFLEDLET